MKLIEVAIKYQLYEVNRTVTIKYQLYEGNRTVTIKYQVFGVIEQSPVTLTMIVDSSSTMCMKVLEQSPVTLHSVKS